MYFKTMLLKDLDVATAREENKACSELYRRKKRRVSLIK